MFLSSKKYMEIQPVIIKNTWMTSQLPTNRLPVFKTISLKNETIAYSKAVFVNLFHLEEPQVTF